MGDGSLLDGFIDLTTDKIGRLGSNHRAQGGVRVVGSTEFVPFDQLYRFFYEAVVKIFVHIDALDAAAGLT